MADRPSHFHVEVSMCVPFGVGVGRVGGCLIPSCAMSFFVLHLPVFFV